MLDDVHESDSCHVCIVSSLVIVGEQRLSLIVAALVLSVKAALQVTFELVIVDALIVHLTQTRVVKGLRVVGQYLRVVHEGEARVPLVRELNVRLGKGADKLVVQVDPVIHAIVSNDWLLRLYHGLDHEREAHLVDVELFNARLPIDLSLDRITLGGALCLFFSFSWLVEGWPLELLSADDLQIQVMHGLVPILATVVDNTVPLW